jgi:pimeloyl-ACP methyl ester carboxylesterase
VVPRWSSWLTSAIAAALLLTACGSSWHPRIDGPFLRGANQYWLVRAQHKPRAVVVLLHGLAPNSGEQLQAWQLHLAEQGDDVIFPRYEDPPPAADARDNIVTAVEAGLEKLGTPSAPLVLIGHSRGGRLAVEAAAYLEPRLVIAFYPGLLNPSFEPDTDLGLIPRTTQIYIFVGDRDRSVGNAGALALARRLLGRGFPASHLHGGVIHSGKDFTADHLSVYRVGPGAQREIWSRADRLIARVSP